MLNRYTTGPDLRRQECIMWVSGCQATAPDRVLGDLSSVPLPVGLDLTILRPVLELRRFGSAHTIVAAHKCNYE